MTSTNRGQDPTQSAPVYTVYPGGYQGNVNPGFQQNHPQAPPPKYEDVISGRAAEQGLSQQPSGAYDRLEPAGIVFVAPVYKYSRMQRTMGLIFTFVFLIFFVSILIKVLSVH